MTGFEGVGLWSIVGTIATVIGGIVTPPQIETYFSLNVDPWDRNETLEDGDEDLKVFFEYLADVSKIDDGRFSIGLKMYFR
jgi:hypothetical protein